MVDIAVDPAVITVTALPYDSISTGAKYVTFTPAMVLVSTIAPLSIDIGEPAPVIEVAPAEIYVTCMLEEPIVGAFIQGDPFSYPWEIYESGTQSFDMTDMTLESADPPGLSRTQWIRYNASVPSLLTINHSGTDVYIVEVYEGNSLTDLANTAGVLNSGPAITVQVSSGYTYIRLSSDSDDSITLTWTYTPSAPPLFMDVLTPVVEISPDTLTVAVQGADPGESVRFQWSPPVSALIPAGTRPITLATISSDPEGNIYIGSVQIPAVFAGTYLLTATGVSSGKQAVASFTVTYDPLPQDSTITDTDPVEAESIKWLWDDGLGHTWVMENNPDSMSSPVTRKVLSPERTTSMTGQHIIWQGARPAVSWSFNGTVLSQSEYEELEYFYGLNRRFFITTHRNKVYLAIMQSFEPTPRRNGANFWTFDYEVGCLIIGEYSPSRVFKSSTSAWGVDYSG